MYRNIYCDMYVQEKCLCLGKISGKLLAMFTLEKKCAQCVFGELSMKSLHTRINKLGSFKKIYR